MSAATRLDIPRPALGQTATPEAQEAWVAEAADDLEHNGVVILSNAIPLPQLSPVLAAIKARRSGSDGPDGRRFQPAPLWPSAIVPLDGAFADPAVFAPPSVLALARRLLGPEMVIGEIGVVLLRPGQGPHQARRAAIPLFGGLEVEGDVPPAALIMLAPLADVGPGMGFPEYWLGSHRTRGTVDTTVEPVRPAFAAGSVAVCDWRTLYRAGVNTSGAPLMGLYVSFQRKWLVSLSGSEYQPGLRIPPGGLKRLPAAYHPLVSWALHQNKTDDLSEFMHLWMGRAVKRLRAVRGG
jgi:hypothetical protein